MSNVHIWAWTFCDVMRAWIILPSLLSLLPLKLLLIFNMVGCGCGLRGMGVSVRHIIVTTWWLNWMIFFFFSFFYINIYIYIRNVDYKYCYPRTHIFVIFNLLNTTRRVSSIIYCRDALNLYFESNMDYYWTISPRDYFLRRCTLMFLFFYEKTPKYPLQDSTF